MRWLQSFGGPLILLPKESVHLWAGSYGPDGDDEIDEEETDYWRICETVEDYADVVDVRGVEALVLANGGCPTAFVAAERLFVQDMGEGFRLGALQTAARARSAVEWAKVVTWNCAGPCLMFDASLYGPKVREPECLPIDLVAGTYTVRSGYWIPDSNDESNVALTSLELASLR
ncbi:Imm21 family immunity protein [Dactylosporangium sp. CS-047395]|uniref:Imm21 family immunity protein n=1 Tax=Dactylosporangium sp. CS-047395 TaxID=3239936 RepID=UPI003D9081CA